MINESNKKLSIIYTHNILREFSDENHLLTQTDIANKIKQIYGMECERKSVSTNIESLIELGVDIVKVPHKGCFLGERTLEPSEVSFIVDALFSSKSISGNQAKGLSQKLSNLLSKYQRKKYTYVYKADQINRTDNKELFYNIDIINEAIEKHKQIKFNYNRYYFKDEEKTRKPYIVNPYFLINSQGKYFLVCNYDYYDEIGNYKVERISNIEILDSDSKPITKVKGFENGIDITKYVNENIYMFATKTIKATVKIYDNWATSYVDEWFGNNSRFYEKDNQIFADIEANESSLIYWCLQYGESIELVKPAECRQKIQCILQQMNDRYNRR